MTLLDRAAARRADAPWLAGPTTSPERLLLGRPVHYVGADAQAFTDLDAADLVTHHRRFGLRPHKTGAGGAALVDKLEAMAIAGRGGGHFPVARKWRAVRDSPGEPVVVANGAEGEPLSRKDAALMELCPHLVLDGLACAAEALDATDAVVWLHDGASSAQTSILRALDERRAAGLVEPPMRVEVGPDRYLTGESSAIVHALSGGPALPRLQRLPTASAGVHGRPTLVQNVETLARVAIAARPTLGAAVTTLLTVAAKSHRVVVEVPSGTRIGDVVGAVLGDDTVHAVLLGGFGGTWSRYLDVRDHAVDEDTLRRYGLSSGAGVLLALRQDECALERAAEITRFLAESSARQCGPCLFGLRAVADLMADLGNRTGRRGDLPRLQRFVREIAGRGACHHPDGAVRMAASAVSAFAPDVRSHLKGRCLHERPGHRHV